VGLEHFIVRRKTVRDEDGKGYVCRGPTIATIPLVLAYYSVEIVAARSAWDDDSDSAETVRSLVGAVLGRHDERAVAVLGTCVSGDLDGATPKHTRSVAETCLSLCDLPRILESWTRRPSL